MAASLFENMRWKPMQVCEENFAADDYDFNYPPLSNFTRPVEVTNEFPRSYSSVCALQPALSEPKSESVVISCRRTRIISRVKTDKSTSTRQSKKKHLRRRHVRKQTTVKNTDFRTTNRCDCLTVEKVKKDIWIGEQSSTYAAVRQPAKRLECWCNKFHYENDMELLDHVIDHHVSREKLLIGNIEQNCRSKKPNDITSRSSGGGYEEEVILISDDETSDVNAETTTNETTTLSDGLEHFSTFNIPETRSSTSVDFVICSEECEKADQSRYTPPLNQLNHIKTQLQDRLTSGTGHAHVKLDYGCFSLALYEKVMKFMF
ncbi:uncharacterized protein LOC141914587 [Tubulanus polymorphus]|uniref:uncharacterized protein LOC141914587 n=1 Tax=Tubulanus polymorphus TaxID=672921 RepID=UPI003DA38BC5